MNDRFSTGPLLRQTFEVFASNFPTFVLMTCLVLSPLIAVHLWKFWADRPGPQTFSAPDLLVLPLSILLTPVVTAALTYGVFQHVRGKPAPMGDCLRTGIRLLFPVLGVSLLSGLAILAGFLACVIPGLVVAAMLAAAVPAAVIERPGVAASLSRSADLTRGYRWIVFAVLFIIGVLNGGLNLVLLLLARVSAGLYLVLYLIILVIFSGLSATAYSLIYYHLRRVKESIDVEEIAAVFD